MNRQLTKDIKVQIESVNVHATNLLQITVNQQTVFTLGNTVFTLGNT